ncbi:MAG: transglycosylase SLT domain-containing protein, partial [Parvibaculaceae bacterium]
LEALARQPHTTVCALIEAAAREHGLPVSFFTRLIWKESAFRPDAVSPKGAQGIAQFMPGTAAMRGLADPFDPHQAIPASASLLRDLRARFGNLGLAAAAYNAGADRVANWMAGTGYLPLETEDYVLSITGTAAERWAEAGGAIALREEKGTCQEFAGRMARRVALAPPIRQANWQPWGVQVTVNFSQARAVAIFNRLKQRHAALIGDMDPLLLRKRNRSRGTRSMIYVRLPAATRAEAGALCAKLMARGGSCMVLKN